MDLNDPNNEGQSSIEQTAQSLFGDINPNLEIPSDLDENSGTVVEEPVQQQQIEEPVQQQQRQQQVVVQPNADELEAFRQWQVSQQQQQPVQQQPIVQQQQQAPVQQQQPQQLSDAEVARLTNRFVIDEAQYDKMFATEDKAQSIAAFNEIVQGAVRQAVTMSQYLAQEHVSRVQQQVQPYMQFADSQRELMLRENFFNKYPDLRGADVIIRAVQQDMSSKGVKYNSMEELFDAVAKASQAQLRMLSAQGQQVNGTQPRVKPAMASLPAGAGGGGSKMAQTGSGPQTTARSLFG